MQPQKIMGIGCLYSDPAAPGGCGGVACDVPMAAMAMGQHAFSASRVGMDQAGTQIRTTLTEAGIDTGAIQVDSDLPTARIARIAFSNEPPRLGTDNAIGNLQWDADLEDMAIAADVVVYDSTSRFNGQCRSTIDRVLDSAKRAIRILDHNTDLVQEAVDSNLVLQALKLADGCVMPIDQLAWLEPVLRELPVNEAASRFLGTHELQMLLLLEPARGMATLQTAEGTTQASFQGQLNRHQALLSLVLAVTAGRPLQVCLNTAMAIGCADAESIDASWLNME